MYMYTCTYTQYMHVYNSIYQVVREIYSGLKSRLATPLGGAIETVVDPVRNREKLLLLTVELSVCVCVHACACVCMCVCAWSTQL